MIEINDGRTRFCTVTDDGALFSCWYRPATLRERRYLWKIIKMLPQDESSEVVMRWIERHIVHKSMRDYSIFRQWSETYEKAYRRLFDIMLGIAPDDSGQVWSQLEVQANRNLADGIRLLRTNAAIAKRSCVDCLKYWYSEKTGEVLLHNSTGEKMLRQGPAPCHAEMGCPKGSPENQRSLTPDNRRALAAFLEFDAVGHFPNDQIVRECAVICRRELNRVIKK